MNTKHETEQWLSPEEVAEATGLDMGEIRHYAALGNFPQGQLRATYGRSVMHWKKQDVDAWLVSLAPQYVAHGVIEIRPDQASNLPPACVDCQHAIPAKSDLLCSSSAVTKQISLVTGEQVGNWCSSQRSLNGECGLDGRFFSLRETSQHTTFSDWAAKRIFPQPAASSEHAQSLNKLVEAYLATVKPARIIFPDPCSQDDCATGRTQPPAA